MDRSEMHSRPDLSKSSEEGVDWQPLVIALSALLVRF